MPSIDELKRYAVLDPDGDEETLKICMEAAEEWFANAGVPRPKETTRLYDLGVYMLAVHYFDNRGAVSDAGKGATTETDRHIPFGVLSIMHQLRL